MQTSNKTGNPHDLTHPRPEEWMAYIYGELPGAEKSRMDGHLRECAGCRIDLKRWQSAGKALDDWKFTPRHTPAWNAQPWLKWGAAAAVVVGIGFFAGRMGATTSRASLKAELRGELLTELKQDQQRQFAEYANAVDSRKRQQEQSLMTAIGSLQDGYASLRHDVDTVAVTTQNSFDHEQQQIATLASYSAK